MLKRIGLFGGTFDPVHVGHTSIAQSFLGSDRIDELWILLTPFPPHKKGQNHAEYEQRLAMLEIGFNSFDNISILTIENELPKPSYTYRTIQHLKENNPDYNYLFCMGEDSLANFHRWKFHERILDEADLIVAHRPGADHSEVTNYILDQTFFVDHEPVAISSSQIKYLIRNQKSISELVDSNVETYIRSSSLYRQN